jgi:hypothetical protein
LSVSWVLEVLVSTAPRRSQVTFSRTTCLQPHRAFAASFERSRRAMTQMGTPCSGRALDLITTSLFANWANSLNKLAVLAFSNKVEILLSSPKLESCFKNVET